MPLVQTDYGLIYNTDGTLYATLRPGEGRFGGAVAVEEGTTNLSDPDFGNWGLYDGLQRASTEETYLGVPVYKVTCDTNVDPNQYIYRNWAASGDTTLGKQATFSVYIKASPETSGEPVELRLRTVGTTIKTVYPVSDKWTRFDVTHDSTERNDTHWDAWITFVVSGDYYIVAPQVEEKPFATSFVDGTRATGGLGYPGSVLPLDEATLICWVKAHEGSPDQRRDFWAINGSVSSDDRLILGRNITGSGWGFHFRLAGGNQFELRHNVPLDFGWHMIGFRYRYNASSDRYDLALIFDGDIVATGTSTNAGMLKNIYRLYSDGNRDAANCLIDELFILPYAATEQEIYDWYENGITHVKKPGYYASFDDSIALQHWAKVDYDYEIINNRIVFTQAPNPKDHIFAMYEPGS